MWPLKKTYRRTLIALQRDLGQNPWDGRAIVDQQPWSFESVWPCQSGIALANGGRSWHIKTPGSDLPKVIFCQQRGTILGSMGDSFGFDIAAGVRQRCVSQPTFVIFSPSMGTIQTAGATQWCWLRLPTRRGFFIGSVLWWWYRYLCKGVWKNPPGIRHVGGCPHASRNSLNIDGFEDFLLGIHLFDADRWSMGRRPHTWDYRIRNFCRYRRLGPWLEEVQGHQQWGVRQVFTKHCTYISFFLLKWLYTSDGFTSCALNGLPTGMQAQSQFFSFHCLCAKWVRFMACRHWPLTIALRQGGVVLNVGKIKF